MIRNIDGESGNSMTNYYSNSVNGLKNHIDAQEEEMILAGDTDELTDYFVQDYLLPELEIDATKKTILEKVQSSRGYDSNVTFKVGLPLVLEEGIEKTISMRASTYISLRFSLENGYMTSHIILNSPTSNADSFVASEIEHLKKTISYKNDSVKSGNKILISETKKYIESRKNKLQQENNMLESISENLDVKLQKKDNAPIVDLKIKKKIRMIMPEPKKKIDAQLEQETLETILELIKNQGRQFENTPKSFAKFNEEELRDIILGMLNSVFPNDVTGESFVGSGKTDIRLKHNNLEGGILTSECKFWGGEQMYRDTIDQHFRYLVWRLDYAIQITFSNNVGFTEVLEKAKKSAQEHSTIIQNSFKEISPQHFVTEHRFPDDQKKKVIVHHLLFNLHLAD